MRWHWQNLNEQPGGTQGWGVRHGRAWFNFVEHCLHVEWSTGALRCGAMLSFDRDSDGTECVALSVQVPLLFTLYIAPPTPKRFQAWVRRAIGDSYSWGREFGFRVFDRAIWWSFAEHNLEWKGDDPWWRHGSWHPIDTFLGRHKFERRILKEEQVAVPMPEGVYPAKATTELCIWKRPRWFAMRRTSVTLDIEKGIPFPGKGENSWDCGDDALFGTGGETVAAAIGNAVASVTKSRARYGGKNWKPAAGWPATSPLKGE